MPTYQDDPVIVRTHQDNAAFNGGVYGESTRFNDPDRPAIGAPPWLL
jgi:hypothetical protein